MIKPDGVQRGLVGEIVTRFEKKGFHLAGLKLMTPTRELLETHYEDLSSKPFFPSLIEYMVWVGMGAVKTGTIRGDFAVDVGRNICHGSDAVESAEKEIALWFPEGVNDWTSHSKPWIYERI